MRRSGILVAAVMVLAACGGGAAPSRASQVRQALTSPPELLEFESPATRQEMFREVARASQAEAGQAATQLVLFPVTVDGGELVAAAPGLDAKMDLLQAPDAGTLLLTFNDHALDKWPEDRRESLMGLSEREAAELVARTLLTRWGIQPSSAIEVDRATGAPYAAAYVDGILRLNPSLLYLAASAGASM